MVNDNLYAFPKFIEDTKMMWNFSSVAILTCHTKNVYKILSLGLSKDSSRKEKVWLVIKDCALSGTLLCSQSIFHSILVISALFSHATQNVLQQIFLLL